MPKFRENRIALLYARQQRLINDEEFLLLYDLNTSASPDFPYWTYENFDLDSLSDEECKAEFRFYRNDIYQMLDVLQLPDEITCYNGFRVDGSEALCIMLKRFAYPCRYLDLIARFAKPVPQLCMVSNHVMNLIYTQWNHLLTDLNQPWLSPANLQQFAEVIHHRKGGALQNCWGFVDGTVRPVQSVALAEIKEHFTMDIRKFIPLNFSRLWPQMALLQICMAQSKGSAMIAACWLNQGF